LFLFTFQKKAVAVSYSIYDTAWSASANSDNLKETVKQGQDFSFSRKKRTSLGMILENKQHSKEVRFGNYMDISKIDRVRQVCEELLLE